MMIREILAFTVLCSAPLWGQAAKQQIPAVGSVENVQQSPAEDALVEQAQQMESTSKAYNQLLQRARADLEQKNKPIVDEIKAKSKKWQDKIDADTKDLKAQIEKNQAEATMKFQQETAAISSKSVSPQTIKALEDVVKKEQNLPATAHYDVSQKKWIDSAKK